MKCPNCNKELEVTRRCYTYADIYNQICTATTECCETLVNIRPIRTYEITTNISGKTEDDWSIPIKK